MPTPDTDLSVLVLAAGHGKRMKSDVIKVLHPIAGQAVIDHVLDAVEPLRPGRSLVVVGHQADAVTAHLGGRDVAPVLQQPQLGTGHAVMEARAGLKRKTGELLVLAGDVPALTTATLRKLLQTHRKRKAAATLLTTRMPDPTGYGRVLRGDGGDVRAIVEHRDASAAERRVDEINSGTYVFDLRSLLGCLEQLGSDNAQGEYYLTDVIELLERAGRTVAAVCHPDHEDVLGVNTRAELSRVGVLLRERKLQALMAAGVSVVAPDSTFVDVGVRVGRDTVLHAGVHLEGDTRIGRGCTLRPGVRVVDSSIGDGVEVLDHSLIESSRLRQGCRVGPLAHLRPGSDLAADVRIGNFVELKKTRLGRGSKVNHLSYLGDAEVGEAVNVGAGTITCNYDGTHKHPTVLEDGVFIGSDSQLVAPVRVGKDSYVAAGSTITRDVPPDSLAVSRARQDNKIGWVSRWRRRRDDGGKG